MAEQQLLQQQERIKAQYRSTPLANGFSGSKESSVLYATIKPEVPPPADLFLECSANGYEAIASTTEKIYHSPQTILDPTRANLLLNQELNPPIPHMTSFGQPPEPPPRPPLPEGPPLDLDGVEYADAEPEEEAAKETTGDNRVDFMTETVMTADEEERLLSAR